MSKKHYNKLVRDRIPEILSEKGLDYETDILDEEAYLVALDAKLDEELAEYHKSGSIEELADLMTVIIYCAAARLGNAENVAVELLNKGVIEKAIERGGFENRILLKWVEEEEDVYEEDLEDIWDDYDWCYECTGYGDDYRYDENGELVSACDDCPNNPNRGELWDD